DIAGGAASANSPRQAEPKQSFKVGVNSRAGHFEFALTALAGEFFSPDMHGDHLALTLGQLLLHGRTHDFSGLAGRDAESLQIVSRPGKDDLEIAGVRCQPGLVQAVINHLVAHPAEAAAAFLDAVKERETLGQDGVAARTGSILLRARRYSCRIMETPPIAWPYSFQIIVRQNVAVAKESEAFLGGLFGRSRFKLVKHWFA